jgi:glucokinase
MAQPKSTAIGIDLGGTNFSVGRLACDGRGLRVRPASFPTPTSPDASAVVEELARRARALGVKGEVAGVGVGIPGVVEPETGRVVRCPNLPALDGAPVGRLLSQALGAPVFLANDAYCATLAELRWGAGRRHDNLVLLTLGTGIGGGVAIGNRVIRGPRQILGEVGHMVLDPDGPRCGCGNHGCFEAFAGRDGIIDRALRKLQDGRPSSLLTRLGDDWRALWGDIPRIVAEEAAGGDSVAAEVMHETGVWIGLGICNALVLCDPDIVVLGGGIAAAGDLLLEPIRCTVEARSRISRGKFDVGNIVFAELGSKAGVCGAASLVWERLAEG